MDQKRAGGQGAAGSEERDVALGMQPISMDDVYRQLILDEIRGGRLTRARRRRIVRYAAQLGLSAVTAGQMIADCRDELLEKGDQTARTHALKIVEPPPAPARRPRIMVKIVAAALLLWLLWQTWMK